MGKEISTHVRAGQLESRHEVVRVLFWESEVDQVHVLRLMAKVPTESPIQSNTKVLRVDVALAPRADPRTTAVLAKLKPEQNARLITALASDAANDVSGQVLVCRGNEILLARLAFPIRGMQNSAHGPWRG